jgi:HAD superfamily hydrolase (TIGR01490 family)
MSNKKDKLIIKKKIAIFDLDYTILKVDSTSIYAREIIRNYPRSLLHLPQIFIYSAFKILNLSTLTRLKEVFYQPLKYLTSQQREDFANLVVEKSISYAKKEALDYIKELKSQGFVLILASASPEYYVEKLAKHFGFDYFVGTRLIFKGKKVCIEGLNCKYEEKVKRIKELIDLEEYDLANSFAYSDNESDIPILKLVGNGFLVSPARWEILRKII